MEVEWWTIGIGFIGLAMLVGIGLHAALLSSLTTEGMFDDCLRAWGSDRRSGDKSRAGMGPVGRLRVMDRRNVHHGFRGVGDGPTAVSLPAPGVEGVESSNAGDCCICGRQTRFIDFEAFVCSMVCCRELFEAYEMAISGPWPDGCRYETPYDPGSP